MRSFRAIALIAAFLIALNVPGSAQAIPTPESVLGHKPGDDFYLATYDEALDYFRKLDAEYAAALAAKAVKSSPPPSP